MKKNKGIANRDIIILAAIVVAIIIAVVVIVVVVNNNNSGNATGGANNGGNGEGDKVVDINSPVSTENPSKENVNVSSDGTKINNSSKLKENKTFKGMVIKDISLSSKSGLTEFTAVVENNTGTDFSGQPIKVVFKNKDGSEFDTLNTYIGSVKNGKTTTINSKSTIDLSNAYDFVISE